MNHARSAILLAFFAAGTTSAVGQLPSIPGMNSLRGVGGMPDISGMGIGNAAGVLGYCTKHKLLARSKDASSVIGTLGKKPGLASSRGYVAGKAGRIIGEKGAAFSLDSAPAPIKSKACGMVLKQAERFL